MPFQPLSETGSEKPTAIDFGLLIIRFVATAAFAYYQLIEQIGRARAFVWNKTGWELSERFFEMDFPFPGVLATTYVAVLAIGLLAVLVGFLTRINAFVTFLLAALALVAPLELSSRLNPQTLVIYLAIFLALAIGGAGKLSLDHVLAGRKARKKVPY